MTTQEHTQEQSADAATVERDGAALLYDEQAETRVIGSMLIDPRVITNVADFLEPEHFFGRGHQLIYAACLALFGEDTEIDQQTLRARLEADGNLEDAGGDHYLSYAVSQTPFAANIRHYATTVVDFYTLRRIVGVGQRAIEVGSDIGRTKDVDAAIKEIEDLIVEVGTTTKTPDFVPLGDAPAIEEYFQDDVDRESSSETAPIETKLEDLDRALGGLHRSDLIVLAARPGFGKSTLALNCALNAALSSHKVGIFSLEMGIDQIVLRLAAAFSRINISSIRRNDLTADEENRLSLAYAQLQDVSIYVDDSPIQTVAAMRSKARRLKLIHGLDLLIVDYMQLISGSTPGREGNRVQEVSEISRYLKAIARDLNVPVLACSQLNRSVEHRKTHEPRLADLRESGSIEQDADIVMFIHREDKFMSEDEWNRRNPTQPYPQGLARLMIAKHRHGQTETIPMSVRDEWGLFSSIQNSY